MAENRLNRELETREKTARKRAWVRADTLPNPTPEEGYEFHWVRVSTRGEVDPMNVSLKLREGWEPVKVADHPELQGMGDEKTRFPGTREIGGLILCRTPKELVDQRNSFYLAQATGQMETVDNNFMRENDPRMPLFKQRRSEVSFGRGQ